MTASMRKIIRITSGVLAFLLAAGLIGFWSNYLAERTISSPFPQLSDTAFRLPSTRGEIVRNIDFLGKPTALFFGFTHCPEICPATLYNLSQMKREIGTKNLQIIFASVDPERDTIPILRDYIEAIDEEAIGLSGTVDEMQALARDFGIYVQKVVLDEGDYTVDHTATVYLYDRNGHSAGTIAWGEAPSHALAKLRKLTEG